MAERPVDGVAVYGDRVAYGDAKNPRRVGTVAEVIDNEYGRSYRVVWDEPDTETFDDAPVTATVSDLRQAGWTFADDPAFAVFAHGHNGDSAFMEPWSVVASLTLAKEVADRVMRVSRFEHRLDDGTPTVRWMEIFGPCIEESIGLEERDGELVWT